MYAVAAVINNCNSWSGRDSCNNCSGRNNCCTYCYNSRRNYCEIRLLSQLLRQLLRPIATAITVVITAAAAIIIKITAFTAVIRRGVIGSLGGVL